MLLDTPIGPLGLSANPDGLARVTFGGPDPGDGDAPGHLAEIRRQLDEYFAGTRRTFELVVDWSGTSGFTRAVLRELAATTGFGETITYGELAARVGHPEASRAVGLAMGSNPIPVVVPCHRVVASGGQLGGFGGGLERKRWLLRHEGALPPTLF